LSIKGSTELLLYGLLLINLTLHRLYGFPNLSTALLLLPLAFLPSERFGLRSRWNVNLLLLPFLYILYPQGFFSLALQAFAEELFFRAYLMQRFSNLAVSALFALPHIILYTDIWSVLTFFPSLFYGYVYQKTGSLGFAFLLHLASNVLWLSFLIPYVHGGH
jgi:membrane protease YdiL (CAAX protease family)